MRPVSLLCLPCAGASATMYLRWRRLLPRWIDLVAVELPGRGARLAEAPLDDYDQLVRQLCAEQAGAMQGRFALFGHSMGALLAQGMAQHLLRQGKPAPVALFASASPAPSRRDPARFANKDSDEALIADLRQQGGTPPEVFAHEELMRLTLDLLAADYSVCRSFRYADARPLPFPVHALGGRQDDIEAERIEAWSVEAGDTFSLDWFDGGHFYLREHESALLTLLTRRLS